MFADARDVTQGEVLTADVCIAGAGAAGIAIARDLIATGLRVIVLESGGFEIEEATQALYAGREEGLASGELENCRLRYFGGTTNHWAGWCRPLDEDVFAGRPGVAPGWPVSHGELVPHYRRALETCGLGAFEFDARSVAERGGRELLPLDSARATHPLYQYSFPPRRFGEYFRDDLEAAQDVTVYLHANLTDIVLAEGGGAVRAFACKTLYGTSFEIQADRFALALGGIENARMLLASRSQEPAGVGNGHDLVGRRFMEHPHMYDGAALLLRGELDLSFYIGLHNVFTYDDDSPGGVEVTVSPSLSLAPPLRDGRGLIAFACELRELSRDNVADLSALGADEIGSLLRGAEASGAKAYRMTIRGEQRPIPDSRVTLTDDQDALGIPKPLLDWRIADDDRADYRRGLELLGAELGRAGAGRLWMPLDDDGLYPRERITGGCHHMGTTAMSESPEDGVVDGDCRVHGLENLYIAGSSVFSSGGYANPTLTIVALAHRLADHLAEASS